MDIALDEVIHFDMVTHSPTTGAAVDADSTPTFACYEEATDTDIGVGGNFTKRTSLTGNYRGTFTLSAANGFEVGKWYSIIASATVGAIAAKAVVRYFRVCAAEAIVGKAKVDVDAWLGTAAATPTVAGVPEVDPTHWNGTAVATPDTAGYPKVTIKDGTGTGEIDTASGKVSIATGGILAASFAAGAIDAAALAADAGTEIGTAVWATTTRALTILDEDSTTLDLDATIRAAVGMASANFDTQIGDLPTNAELATSQAAADDATIAAIGALNNLSAAQVNAEVDTALADYDGPTHAELTSALAAADDAVLAQVALVKAKTDSLTFTVAGVADTNIQYVNDVQVNGDGSAGTPWGP